MKKYLVKKKFVYLQSEIDLAMKCKNKLGDFPIEDEYPFGEEVINDVMDNFLCFPKDRNLKGVSVVKCDGEKLMQDELYVITDRQEFRKLYKSSIEIAFGLSSTAVKVMLYIMYIVQQGSESIDIVPKHCMDKCGFKTLKSVRDGIVELLEKKIIAKTKYSNKYWINPVVVFNGDRVEFTRKYVYEERKK